MASTNNLASNNNMASTKIIASTNNQHSLHYNIAFITTHQQSSY